MNIAILLNGPRGAGKSRYAELVVKANPDIVLVSRDKIREAVMNDTGCWTHEAKEESLRIMTQQLVEAFDEKTDATVIFDFMTNDAQDRRKIILWLRSVGADRVIAWDFTTPLDQCLTWCEEKKKTDTFLASPQGWQQLIALNEKHRHCSQGIGYEGFNLVYHINPILVEEPVLLV